MTEITAVIATTGIVERGGARIMIAKEAIESIPGQIAGDRAAPMIANHDPFCLPIGKLKEAWVEPLGSELAAVVSIQIEDNPSIETNHSGVGLVRLDFEDDPRPFKRQEMEIGTLAVDQANFDNVQDYNEFTKDVGHIDDKLTCSNGLGRHALTPEPLIQFVVSNPEISAALAWILQRLEIFVRYTVDETLRKVADDISDSLSAKLKNILKAYGNRRSNDSRPTVTKIIIPGDTELTLLVKTGPGEEFPAMDLRKLTAEMEEYGELLQEADCATFTRVGVNDWEFLYLTTRSGKVIGTLECHERTLDLLRSMRKGRDSEAEDSPQDD